MCVCGTRNIKGVYCGTPQQRAWWERCAVHTRTTLEYSFGVCVFIGMASPIRIYIYMHIHIHVHGMNESHTHRCGERERKPRRRGQFSKNGHLMIQSGPRDVQFRVHHQRDSL